MSAAVFTYFLVSVPNELRYIRSEADLLTHIEKLQPQVGGIYSREQIDSLSRLFLKKERRSVPTQEKLADASNFFQLDSELVRHIAEAQQDELLDASALWDEEAWQVTDVNRMDLAGFLLEFAQLCRGAVAIDKNVYFVFAGK